MTARNYLGVLLCLTAVACPVDNNLGETATGGTGEGTGGSDAGAVSAESIGSGGPSGATSGQTDTGPEASTSGGDSSSTGGGGDESSGSPAMCGSPDDTYASWISGGTPFAEGSQRAAVEGPCLLLDVGGEPPLEGEPTQLDIQLRCTLNGLIDGMPVARLVVEPAFGLTTTAAIPPIDESLYLRVAYDSWFEGTNRWFILGAGVEGEDLIFEGIVADGLDPGQGDTALSVDIETVFGPGGWPSPVAYEPSDTACLLEDECGATPRAIAMTTEGDTATLDVGQSTALSLVGATGDILVSVNAAHEYVGPDIPCTDLPVAVYDLLAMAEAP